MAYTVSIQHGPAPVGALNWRLFEASQDHSDIHVDVSDLGTDYQTRNEAADAMALRRLYIVQRAFQMSESCSVILYTNMDTQTCVHNPAYQVSECFCALAMGLQCPHAS
jgi:hypothetical protein